MRLHPALREGHRLGTAPLLLEKGGPGLRVDEAVVVDLEAPGEAEARGERERAHEGAGRVAARLEESGQGLDPGREAEPRVVPHPVVRRVAAGEDVRVRGESHHVVGVGVFEAHARGGEAVHPRRPRIGLAIGADRVGPERVDGDEEDAEARLNVGSASAGEPEAAAGQDHHKEDAGGHDPGSEAPARGRISLGRLGFTRSSSQTLPY